MLPVLKRGSRGKLVGTVQGFLRDEQLYLGVVDGKFGKATARAVRAYQQRKWLKDDGVIGNQTWGEMMVAGLVVVPSTTKATVKDSPNWPPPPKDLRPLYGASRAKLFGEFQYKHAPTKTNPELVKILGNWQKDNLVSATIPQLIGVDGARKTGRIFCHRLAAEPFKKLFQAWEDAELIDRVDSWAGSWAPRFVRGSRTTLSNHAYGTAFDINAWQNRMGRRPALVGGAGSVRELVPIANKLGWYWGGHFTRMDGMHFELVKL